MVARADRMDEPSVMACKSALLGLSATPQGRQALKLLSLDAIEPGEDALFDGIAARMAVLSGG
jgi:phosphonate transport system substrate-binding protein